MWKTSPDAIVVIERKGFGLSVFSYGSARYPNLQNLPIDNGGQDEDQTAGPTHLLLEIAPVGVPALAIMDMARQGMELLPLEQPRAPGA